MDMSKVKTLMIAVLLLSFTAAVITHPQESFDASKSGLAMWWEVVFPSLLPFFILSELLIGFGVVRFVGLLLEPFMRPVFRVPGVGGFVLAMGMASGNPAGAKLTSRLRQERQISGSKQSGSLHSPTHLTRCLFSEPLRSAFSIILLLALCLRRPIIWAISQLD